MAVPGLLPRPRRRGGPVNEALDLIIYFSLAIVGLFVLGALMVAAWAIAHHIGHSMTRRRRERLGYIYGPFCDD